MAFCVWYVAVKPNIQRPGKPHAAKSLNAAFSALKAAARLDEWNRTVSNGETYGGVPGFAISGGERRTLTGLLAALGKTYPTGDGHRKLPMRLALLVRMAEAAASKPPTWEGTRDRVWMFLGHQGLLRASEICALRAEDIRLVRDELGNLVAVQVRIVTSKTAEHLDEATGGVQHVTIARRPDACDVVVPLMDWMETLGMLSPGRQLVSEREKDYLFPARQGSATPITKVMISEALRAGLVAIGMDEAMIASYSGRSLRAGGTSL